MNYRGYGIEKTTIKEEISRLFRDLQGKYRLSLLTDLLLRPGMDLPDASISRVT
ncbi:hypothetical protein ACFPFV_02260 [Salinicoccus siamensis]|uniref:hypothetical protein n=1 Tax=Salinicoccus siamensis TaxID=381830 RepID=UPI003612E280